MADRPGLRPRTFRRVAARSRPPAIWWWRTWPTRPAYRLAALLAGIAARAGSPSSIPACRPGRGRAASGRWRTAAAARRIAELAPRASPRPRSPRSSTRRSFATRVATRSGGRGACARSAAPGRPAGRTPAGRHGRGGICRGHRVSGRTLAWPARSLIRIQSRHLRASRRDPRTQRGATGNFAPVPGIAVCHKCTVCGSFEICIPGPAGGVDVASPGFARRETRRREILAVQWGFRTVHPAPCRRHRLAPARTFRSRGRRPSSLQDVPPRREDPVARAEKAGATVRRCATRACAQPLSHQGSRRRPGPGGSSGSGGASATRGGPGSAAWRLRWLRGSAPAPRAHGSRCHLDASGTAPGHRCGTSGTDRPGRAKPRQPRGNPRTTGSEVRDDYRVVREARPDGQPAPTSGTPADRHRRAARRSTPPGLRDPGADCRRRAADAGNSAPASGTRPTRHRPTATDHWSASSDSSSACDHDTSGPPTATERPRPTADLDRRPTRPDGPLRPPERSPAGLAAQVHPTRTTGDRRASPRPPVPGRRCRPRPSTRTSCQGYRCS